MNFLAHAFLSGSDPKIMTGNFIADFVKGKSALQNLDPVIAKGVELHRAIDLFTDRHPIVKSSKQRLQSKYRHYAAVIVDIFYDHFLAKNWHQYHKQSLKEFAAHVYETIETYHEYTPPGARHMLPYMISGNWLVSYARLDGIAGALSGMARRTPYDSKMDEAIFDLEKDYSLYEKEFRQFFPMLKKMCDDWLNANSR